jgi:hypothetical protein
MNFSVRFFERKKNLRQTYASKHLISYIYNLKGKNGKWAKACLPQRAAHVDNHACCAFFN